MGFLYWFNKKRKLRKLPRITKLSTQEKQLLLTHISDLNKLQQKLFPGKTMIRIDKSGLEDLEILYNYIHDNAIALGAEEIHRRIFQIGVTFGEIIRRHYRLEWGINENPLGKGDEPALVLVPPENIYRNIFVIDMIFKRLVENERGFFLPIFELIPNILKAGES